MPTITEVIEVIEITEATEIAEATEITEVTETIEIEAPASQHRAQLEGKLVAIVAAG